MTRQNFKRGVTLIEMVIASAISVVIMLMLWSGVRYLQQTLSQQMKLDRVSQALVLTQDITKTTREARRVLSVGPDHLDLEVFNYGAYGILDPRLYEKSKVVSYQFRTEGESTFISRDVYDSTDVVRLESSRTYLKDAQLITPTASTPYFFASYLVGPSTVGVRVELALHPPYSTERWVPIKDEVYVQAN